MSFLYSQQKIRGLWPEAGEGDSLVEGKLTLGSSNVDYNIANTFSIWRMGQRGLCCVLNSRI